MGGSKVRTGQAWGESRRGSGAGKDEVDRALLEVSCLIEDAVAVRGGSGGSGSDEPPTVPVAPDEASITAAIAEQVGRARQSVDICFAEHTTRTDRCVEILRARDEAVPVRLLFAGSGHASAPGHPHPHGHAHGQGHGQAHGPGHRHNPPPAPQPWEALAAHEHVLVRTARVPLIDCVVVDGTSALLIADSAMGPQVSLTRSCGVVGALHSLFAAVWRGATPVPAGIDWGSAARAEFVAWILGCLHSGMTDQQAADELSVSLRTYRRYVAEIMTALGATSRFQAGLRAAELGLLPAPVPPSTPPRGRRPDPSA